MINSTDSVVLWNSASKTCSDPSKTALLTDPQAEPQNSLRDCCYGDASSRVSNIHKNAVQKHSKKLLWVLNSKFQFGEWEKNVTMEKKFQERIWVPSIKGTPGIHPRGLPFLTWMPTGCINLIFTKCIVVKSDFQLFLTAWHCLHLRTNLFLSVCSYCAWSNLL